VSFAAFNPVLKGTFPLLSPSPSTLHDVPHFLCRSFRFRSVVNRQVLAVLAEVSFVLYPLPCYPGLQNADAAITLFEAFDTNIQDGLPVPTISLSTTFSVKPPVVTAVGVGSDGATTYLIEQEIPNFLSTGVTTFTGTCVFGQLTVFSLTPHTRYYCRSSQLLSRRRPNMHLPR
jgi:hypothetical protein